MTTRPVFRVSPFLIPSVCLLLAVFPEPLFPAIPCFLLSALLHESAHLLFLSVFHVPLREISVSPGGCVIRGDFSRCSYVGEALIHAAGGSANLLCAFLFSGIFPRFALSSLALGLFNLLPLSSLDGGRMLSALCRLLPGTGYSADRICRIVSFLAYAALYALSGAVFWAGTQNGTFSPLAGALFFAVSLSWAKEMLSQ